MVTWKINSNRDYTQVPCPTYKKCMSWMPFSNHMFLSIYLVCLISFGDNACLFLLTIGNHSLKSSNQTYLETAEIIIKTCYLLNNRIHVLLVTEAEFNLLFFFTITMFCLFNSVSWAYIYWIFFSLCSSPVIWNTSNYCCFRSILHWTASLWSHWVITETPANLNGSRTKPVKHSLNSCTSRVFTNSKL